MAVPHRAGRGLKVHLDGDEIVVWQRGTVFLIAFNSAPASLDRHAQLAFQLRVQTPCRVSSESGSARGQQGPGAWLGSCRRLGGQAHQAKPGGARSSASLHRAIGAAELGS
jgi:hypothetical protein